MKTDFIKKIKLPEIAKSHPIAFGGCGIPPYF
jgi:hypothetical protein